MTGWRRLRAYAVQRGRSPDGGTWVLTARQARRYTKKWHREFGGAPRRRFRGLRGTPAQVMARQVTPSTLWDVFGWIPAGAPHNAPGEIDGLTLYRHGRRAVAYFGDWIVRANEGSWTVCKEAAFSRVYEAVPQEQARLQCCSRVYFCPAAGETECPDHGGFDTCCDNPDRHRPVAVTT